MLTFQHKYVKLKCQQCSHLEWLPFPADLIIQEIEFFTEPHSTRLYTLYTPVHTCGKEVSLLADTEFKVFAGLLTAKYLRGRKPEDFTKELFEKIYLPETVDSPVEDTLPRTYHGYYYGAHNITRLASKIAGSLDTESFARYIETDTDDTIAALCDSFRRWYPDINEENYSKK